MATTIFVLLLVFPSWVFGSFFQIDYPNVNISADPGGDLTFEAGTGGDVILKPGQGGTVYISGTDLRKFIEKVKSLPPVWTKQSVHGTLGTFLSGSVVSVSVQAVDPDGGNITYQLVSGHLPPGTNLNAKTGRITGRAPDVDATYTFTIRATDHHGKYADGSFSIDIRERDQCLSHPCQHGGSCTDGFNGFNCTCGQDYGGSLCETNCPTNAFGVTNSRKKIPDAQMSAHYTYTTQSAANGRLQSSSGWIGTGAGSWLQVDLGEIKKVYTVATQGFRSSSYYTLTYNVQYSADGNNFKYIEDSTGGHKAFAGSVNYDTVVKHYLTSQVSARFVRFLPLTWHSGGNPGLRVEIYGC